MEAFSFSLQLKLPETFLSGYLHRNDVGGWSVGHGHPVRQVHAAVAVGPEERVRMGDCQGPGALPPLGGVLWRLHEGNSSRREEERISSTV